jgi:hypothetical protein
MNTEDTFLVECENEHRYAMVLGESPDEYPCPFCLAPVAAVDDHRG